MRISPFTILLILAAAAGLLFSSVSTYDFAQHLDRQVHGIHCSFVPGLASVDVSGATGCHVTMMSPYSSIFRKAFWGGLPISLPSMAVFAFLAFKGLEILIRRRQASRADTLFLVLASLVPVLASVVMGIIAFTELDAACKLCIGIYVSSGLCLLGALGLWSQAKKAERLGLAELGDPEDEPLPSSPASVFASGGLQGLAFVALPMAAWVLLTPDHSGFVGQCGRLEAPEDPHGIMIPLDGSAAGGIPTIEVFDPLCPACQGFENRLAASDLGARLSRKAVLFPLDSTCNWMITSSLHPGACTVSEAILCAGDKAQPVVDWALAEQASIRAQAAEDPQSTARLVSARFPELASCIGKPAVKAKINHSLRWTVKNRLPVLTPQLYVDGVRMCDEDTDLGMDFALARMIEMHEAGTLDGGEK